MYHRVHSAYASLSTDEQLLADILLERPENLGRWTATELAEHAGVSGATVTRVFQRLGYSTYDEARQMARKARSEGSPLYLGNRAEAGNGPLEQAMADELDVLNSTLSGLDPQTLEQIVQALATARRIRTLGFRNSHFIADYAAASLSQLRPGVSPLLMPGQIQGESLAEIGPADLVLIVGLRRRPRGFMSSVKAIAEQGARVVLIADSSIRQPGDHVTWTIDCVVETRQCADSYGGAMALVRLLTMGMSKVLGKAGRDYLGEVESLRSSLDELE